MDTFKTIFNCGVRLRQALLADEELCAMTDRVIPVVTPVSQTLPFITYYRESVNMQPVKGTRGPASVIYHFQIYSAEWPEGSDIAARVAGTLDGYADDAVRSCVLQNATENHDPAVPAFIQILSFEVRPRL